MKLGMIDGDFGGERAISWNSQHREVLGLSMGIASPAEPRIDDHLLTDP